MEAFQFSPTLLGPTLDSGDDRIPDPLTLRGWENAPSSYRVTDAPVLPRTLKCGLGELSWPLARRSHTPPDGACGRAGRNCDSSACERQWQREAQGADREGEPESHSLGG